MSDDAALTQASEAPKSGEVKLDGWIDRPTHENAPAQMVADMQWRQYQKIIEEAKQRNPDLTDAELADLVQQPDFMARVEIGAQEQTAAIRDCARRSLHLQFENAAKTRLYSYSGHEFDSWEEMVDHITDKYPDNSTTAYDIKTVIGHLAPILEKQGVPEKTAQVLENISKFRVAAPTLRAIFAPREGEEPPDETLMQVVSDITDDRLTREQMSNKYVRGSHSGIPNASGQQHLTPKGAILVIECTGGNAQVELIKSLLGEKVSWRLGLERAMLNKLNAASPKLNRGKLARQSAQPKRKKEHRPHG